MAQNPWDNLDVKVPTTAPDFEQPLVDPPHVPVDIPQEAEDE